MATVTFPIELGGSGLVVSDDTDPITGLRNGGYLTRFVPALQQTVAVAGFVVGQVSNAAASASAAAGSASAASSSASSAASSAASAATLYDQFDDRYLGPKASNPTVDNDGNALLVGAMYFNTAALETRVWNGTTWQSAATVGGTVNSLTVTGALQYQGTLTGGTGVINIGSGQLVKDTAGNLGLGLTPSDWGGASTKAFQIGVGGLSVWSDTAARSTFNNNAFFNGTNRIYLANGVAHEFQMNLNGNFIWSTAPSGTAGNPITFTQAMTLTNGGNLLVGTTTDILGRIQASSTGAVFRATSTSSTAGLYTFVGPTNSGQITNPSGAIDIATNGGTSLSFTTNSTERARITSGGYSKASNTGSYGGVAGAADFSAAANHVIQSSTSNVDCLSVLHSQTTAGSNTVVSYLPTGSLAAHYRGRINNVDVYQVLANGDVRNTNNSYGAISDPKLKDIIGPKSSTWEKTKQYNWVEYYLKSDTEHTFKMLGLNAEEAAAVSPGVVDESPDLVEVTKVRQVPVQIVRLDENENPVVDEETGAVIYDEVMVNEPYTEWEPNGEFTKSVKYSVVSMQYHRTTQECQQRIEDLEAAKLQTDDLIQQIMGRVAALESASA